MARLISHRKLPPVSVSAYMHGIHLLSMVYIYIYMCVTVSEKGVFRAKYEFPISGTRG